MCGITGDIVYLVRSISAVTGLLPNQELGYSFYLSLLGSFCLLVSGTVVKIGAIQRFRDQARENGLVCHVTQPPPYSSITIAHNYIQEQLLQITLSPPAYESLTNQDQGADHSQQVHSQEPPPPYSSVGVPQPSSASAVISQSPPPSYV